LRFLGHLLTAVVVALVVGFGFSWYTLNEGSLFGTIAVGPWSAWQQAGTETPDPYTRAHVARSGALQLGNSEGLQFVATTDSDGLRLDRDCRYRIHGMTPVATFWSMVPVAPNGTIITLPGAPPAFHSKRVARATDGSLQLYVSKTLSPRNWLEITGEGPFALQFTLYDASSFAGVGTAEAEMPTIIREACL
jgi:hypothetical protein